MFLDGHMDLYDGVNSAGGEAADMPMAVLLGRGPGALGQVVGASVLEPSELTVDAPQPDGLLWSELAALLRPLVRDPACLGITLACYNSDLDVDSGGARKVVDLLAEVVPA